MRRASRALLLVTAAFPAAAEERIADIRQGTNLSATLAPGGATLVVDLLEQLWSLPAAGGGAVPLTSSDERARNPRFSPDGTRVVYQRRNGEHWDLWLLDLATREQRPLVESPYDEREPDFTADGRAVVFASDRTGRYCLWSMTIDGGVATQLTEEPGAASYPAVSEHGVVAYVLAREGEWSIRVLGSDGAIAVAHTSVSRLWAPSWRPGGGVLVFGEQDSPETSRLQLLLLGEPRVLKSLTGGEDLFASRPAWRSGAEFIYAADGQLWRRGIATPTREPVHLFAASAVEVATPPNDLPAPDDSASRSAFGVNGVVRTVDGRRTAFTALGDVWLAERGEPRRLTDDVFLDLDPGFWPDGDSLVIASERTGQFELWRLAVRDGASTQLTFGALQPRRPVVRPDGNVVAYLESASLEPAATSVVKTLDWQRREETTVATDVVAGTALAWDADGRTLIVRARSAAPAGGRDVRIDLGAGPPAAGAETRPTVQWQAPAPPSDYVVEVGRLFDGVRGSYHRHVDLHVRGGRIAAIVGRGVLPAAGQVIDAREATIIPGLVDLHAHQSSLLGERLGRAWLAYGVTTVRELAADLGEAVERAEAWSSGRSPGPRLIVSPTTPASASAIDAGPAVRTYPGISHGLAHSLRRQAREIAVPAWDLATIPARLRGDTAAPTLELELSPAFTTYQDGFSRLIAAEATFVTGLAALAGLRGWPTPRPRRDDAFGLFTPVELAAWERPDALAPAVPSLQRTIARLVRTGGRVGVGSDAPAVPYGLGVHLELALLAQAGIANDQVLRMATAGGALALGLEREIGTLEPGKLADFVVVDGDPLTHIADTLRVVAVAKGGAWHDRSALLAAR